MSCERTPWIETASESLGGGNGASTRGAIWTGVIRRGAKEESVGGSNVVLMRRVVRSMDTSRLAGASWRVQHNEVGLGFDEPNPGVGGLGGSGDFGGGATTSHVARGLLSDLSMEDEPPGFRLV